MDKPVRSIAIDPIYARANSGRRFMTAMEDKLILHEKTFLSRSYIMIYGFIPTRATCFIGSVRIRNNLMAVDSNLTFFSFLIKLTSES